MGTGKNKGNISEEIMDLIEDAFGSTDPDTELDIRHTEVHFDGMADGTTLRVFIQDVSGHTPQTVGALHLTRKQWEDLKEIGDLLLGVAKHLN